MDRVCGRCNSLLGHRVDAALSDNLIIRWRRADLGLVGNSGEAPGQFELLTGKHKLAARPEQYVRVSYDETTRKLDVTAVYHASDVVLPDGTRTRRIEVDARDRDQIPKIIQRERKRHGLPLLSPEQLAAEVERATQNVVSVQNPQVLIETSASFAYVRHAMVKIAYELAFLWLGEAYLDDPTAAELREAICGGNPRSTDALPGTIGDASECGAFNLWSADKVHHIAFANVVPENRSIVIAVRVFDIFAAVVQVTREAHQYLTSGDAESKLRFLAMEPVSGNMSDVPLMQEFMRIATLMTKPAS